MSKREFRPGEPIKPDYPPAEGGAATEPPVIARPGVPRMPDRVVINMPGAPRMPEESLIRRILRHLFRRR